MVYFISDTHLGHGNIIRYCHRPFRSVGEMDEALIANWNAVVKPTDTVFVVGDFAFRNAERYLSRLNGQKILISGHHDRITSSLRRHFKEITSFKQVTIEGQQIVLCHYPLREWPGRDQGAWQVHGHSHGKGLPLEGKQWDVGVDVNDYRPVSLVKLRSIMAQRIETRRPAVDDPFEQGRLQEKCSRRLKTPNLKARLTR